MSDAFNLKAALNSASYAAGQTMTLAVSGTVTASTGSGLAWVISSISDNLGHKWVVAPDGHSATAKA